MLARVASHKAALPLAGSFRAFADKAASGEPAASSQQEAKASPTTPTPPAGAEGAHQAQVGKQASKKQSSRVDAVAQKIKLNKGLKHEDDLTAEVGLVGVIERSQEFDHQLLLAKRRLGMNARLEKPGYKGVALEQLIKNQSGSQ